ncbi:ejaculatory bulb-specific protein 3-like [Ctenocephalides felis]|uniref:ejaculatory bulb-specific protein 3-like n=1 Tax=Ctenocephalides felis TaxID=7515 RepID=UPI000E6E1069|nr:ejaculatory bulb-specific protein 3-like [Ctenocephalides felis]
MKLFVAGLLLCMAVAISADEVKYTTKYDGVNLDEILASDRLLGNYLKCLNDEGKCTPDGTELKRVLPDALQHNCSGCSEKQKAGAEKVIRFLIQNKSEEWAKLQKKYDPTGEYTQKYRDQIPH